MKNIYRIAALAAAVALTSCTIDIIGPDGPDTRIDGARTIAVSFAPSTKSKLNGVQPEFKAGDKIMVSNGNKTQTCTVNYDHNGGASFTTELEGDLTAVYPTTAAKLKGPEIIGILVPQDQTGKFEDANIAKANIEEGAPTAVFQNQTAILSFYVDASIGVNSIEIHSEGIPIADNNGLNVYIKNGAPLDQITDDPAHRLCYAAVLPGEFKQLKVTSYTETQAEVNRTFDNVNLPANTLANVFMPYYIPVNVGSGTKPEYQYWAYCNLGAFLPEEQGLYFAWGETTGHEYNDKTYKFEDGHDFNWANCPFNNGSEDYNSEYFTKLKETVCPDGVLDMKYDAANAILGGNWRIPNWSDFQKLIDNTKTTGKDISDVGYRHLQIAGTDLIFPATGHGYGETVTNPGIDGSYWSSNLSGEENNALTLIFSGKNYGPTSINSDRYAGHTIRPIYGTPAPAIPSGALPGEFTVAVDITGQGLPPTKVHFSKGNLQATYKSTDYVWGFAEHQYDYIGDASGNLSIDSPNNGDVVDLFGWVGKSSSFTGAAAYGISSDQNPEDYSNDVNDVLKSDWGNTIDNKGTWRTLSIDEWHYLLYLREMKNDGDRYKDYCSGGITLKDKNENEVTGYGLVLYPDGFADQDSWVNAYKTWDEFAQNGLVLLPAAGKRETCGASYCGNGGYGYYWSSTLDSEHSGYAHNLWTWECTINYYTFDTGNSVRLVTNCATNK